MFYEAELAFNEGGNDGFWRFQLRDKYGRWVKMGGMCSFDYRLPNDTNVYKAHGTFQGNIRRGWSIIRVGEGEQLPPGDYEIDSRYIEAVKAVINTTSAKPETVDAPKVSVNPEVEKQAAEREMVAATVGDLEAGDIVQQSTKEALYGQINSVEHGNKESKINVTWSDGSNYDMALPKSQKVKVWGAEPEAKAQIETVDAGNGGVDWANNDEWYQQALDNYEANRALMNGDSNAPTDFVPGDNLYSEFEGSTLKTVPSKDPNKQFDVEATKQSGLQIVDFKQRKVVMADINGVQVPFYLSTGQGGKADVQAGKWYPFFGVEEGSSWINKASGKYINEYYGSPELRAQAEWLDANIGDIRDDNTIPLVRAEDVPAFLEKINQDTHQVRLDKEGLGNDKLDTLIKANIADIVDRVRMEPEAKAEIVDAPKGEPVERNKVIDSIEAADELNTAIANRYGVDYEGYSAASVFKQNLAKNLADAMLADGISLRDIMNSTDFSAITNEKPVGALSEEKVFNKVQENEEDDWGVSALDLSSILESPYNDDTIFDGSGTSLSVLMIDDRGAFKYSTVDIDAEEFKGKTLAEIQKLLEEYSRRDYDEDYKDEYATYKDVAIIGTSTATDMITHEAVSRLVQTWAQSSNDSNARSLAIQEIAKELFGLDKTSPWSVDDNLQKRIDGQLKAFGDVYRSLLTNQYKATQEFLAEQGIKEFIAYRGLWTLGDENALNIGTNIPVSMRPLSSFTTNLDTAQMFAEGYGADFDGDEQEDANSYIIKTRIKAEDIFSVPGLGFGCLGEKELVVLGRLNTVSMLKKRGDASIKDDLPPEPVAADKPKSLFEAPTDPAEIEALKAKAEEQKARVAEVEKEREERLKLKAEQEAKAAESYRMSHRPPSREDAAGEGVAASLDKIDEVFPKDILDPTKQENLYRTGDAQADKETFDVINSIKGNPDAEVTIYRGVPDGVDTIGAGDWVTLSPSYAQHHVDANVPDGKVISMKVKASELFTNADSINEWGYDPEPETVDAGNVEEAKPEVPERTKVIASEREASTFYQEFRKKFGLSSAPSKAAAEHKKNAAKIILDKLLESGITPDQIAAAARSAGVFTIKSGSDSPDSLDDARIANKLPEISIGYKGSGLTRVSATDLLNTPYDDNTVVESSAPELNVMKFNEDGVLELFTIPNIEGQVEVAGKTLKEIETAISEEPSLSGYYGKLALAGTSESKRMLAEYVTSKMIHQWANTSNDTDADSLAMQEAAEELFGLKDAAPWQMDEGLENDVALNLKDHGDVYKAFLQAQYDATQAYLGEQGIKEFVLYRGYTSEEDMDEGPVTTTLRPLSSFSTSQTTAEQFALPSGYETGYLLQMTVPAKDIFSMPGLGFGCLEEEEFVVLGGKKAAYMEVL